MIGSHALLARFGGVALCTVLLSACGDEPLGPDPEPQYPPVRVVTFGDSNTDYGYAATEPIVEARSYVSNRVEGRLAASAPHHPAQLAGLIEAGWTALDRSAITVVNHGIGGTSSGGGGFGGNDRHSSGAPNARALVAGVSRYEAEVLGTGYPWSGGEGVSTDYPGGAIVRTNAFTPGANDFAYVSIGTNDASYGIPADQTIANLTWMIDRWVDAGLPPGHFLISTLAPRTGTAGAAFPQINAAIRDLAAARGVKLVDLAAFTSDDDGATWRSADLHVGDGLHYTTAVRAWIATQVIAHISSSVVPA